MKLRTLLLTLVALLGIMQARADVTINETNFPDENFRNCLLNQSYGSDGVITDDEIAGITKIDALGNITSLKGIEFFTALEYLNCYMNQLTSLDVSKNTALTLLECSGNKLTSLDVSKNTALTSLSCGGNQLTSLDVSKNTALTDLYCSSNQLISLDVSKNTALTYLLCYDNQLTSLDVSKNTALIWLECGSNQLTSLDVSKNTALTWLGCDSNQLTSLDVSKNTALESLSCYLNLIKGSAMDALVESLPNVNYGIMYVIYNENEGNVMNIVQVVAAKVKGWTPYYTTDGEYWKECYDSVVGLEINEENFPDENFRNWLLNQNYGSDGVITDDEISGITKIDVYGNGITSLKGIEFFTKLTELECGSNQLTSLDVSKNTALTLLECSGNKLTSLDVSKNTALTMLHCYMNQLTSLDVSKNTALEYLNCFMNQLTSLDVSKNTALTWLGCDSNQLASLDVSKNTALKELSCGGNQLTSLDVSKNTALTDLYCNKNQLTSLDVSKNMALTVLVCYQNQIKGSGMDALVESLPKLNSQMYVIYNKNESNVMTTVQVAAAKAKGWIPYYYIDKGKGKWEEYPGSDPSGIEKFRNSKVEELKYYDLNGRQVKTPRKGVYIINGKKVLVK